MKTLTTGILSALLLATAPAGATQPIEQKQVQFSKGQTSATLKGTIKGDQIIDYQVRAGAGQVMTVRFKPSNLSTYFNVLPPGSEEAIFIGSTSGNEFSGGLKLAGVYTIRVYLMRNAARRNESTSYTLDVGVSGAVKPSSGAAAPVAATQAGPSKWDASGNMQCPSGSDSLDRPCGFRVVRNLPTQAADIWVGKLANGEAGYRFFHFENQ